MDDLAAAARRYIGARWRHQGRLDNRLDCWGLLLKAGKDAGMDFIDPLTIQPYGVNDRNLIFDWLKEHGFRAVNELTAIQANDLLVLGDCGRPRHLAIVADHPAGGYSAIHCSRDLLKVVEERVTAKIERQIRGVFRWRV